MHQPQYSSGRTWARTRSTWSAAEPTPSRTGAVSTLRVKLIGADPDASSGPSPRRFDTTQRYGRVLPSFEDCIAIDGGVDEERNVYMDITGMIDRDDAFDPSIAFARTLPALTPWPPLRESGVRTRDRLTVQPESTSRVAADTALSRPQPDTSSTLRLAALPRGPMSRAWCAWNRQPASIAISTAAAICFLSVLAVRLLMP